MRIPWMLVAMTLAASAVPGSTEDAATNPGTKRLTDKLATEYKVPAADIDKMRADKLGWGEIGNALAISQKAGVPLDQVLAARKSGLGWGEIAQKYGFKLGEVAGKAKSVEREGRKADRDDHPAARDRDDARPSRGSVHGAGAGVGHGRGGGRGR